MSGFTGPKYSIMLILAVCLFALVGCTKNSAVLSEPGPGKVGGIRAGDSREHVISRFGNPSFHAVEGEREVLQYCDTGFVDDKYVVVWVEAGEVVGSTVYFNFATGDCTSHFRDIAWADVADAPGRKGSGGGTASGTGFVVNARGDVMTNAHVVDGCSKITIRGIGPARVLAADSAIDVAALSVEGAAGRPYARFDGAKIARLGEEVVVFGFPLGGILSSTGNLTTGNLSALAGLGNNTSRYQISAPVQPGNSGGPLLDRSGKVLGVIVSKLNTLKAASMTGGDIAQNVNFAVKGSLAKSFLDLHGVHYSESGERKMMSVADVADAARRFTVFIECELAAQ